MFIYKIKSLTIIALVFTIGFAAKAQSNITAIEYFFDTDPGFNLAIPVSVSSPANELVNMPISINVNSLSIGMHTFYIRTKNAANLWSITNWSKIYKEFLYPLPAPTGPLRRLEYFIDIDPGFGNATSVTIPAGQTEIANLFFNINLSTVPPGNHLLYVRTLDDEWGLTNVVPFTTNSTLPVRLLNFDVRKEGKAAVVLWQTSAEQNNEGFNVERSGNGIDFVKIGHIKGKRNSTTRQDYSFTDLQPSKGFNYYRLRQFDIDGRNTLSYIRTVEFNELPIVSLILYPNPSIDFVKVQLSENFYGRAANISLIDYTGRIVKQWIIKSIQPTVLTLPIGELPKGMWRLVIVTQDNVASGNFIK